MIDDRQGTFHPALVAMTRSLVVGLRSGHRRAIPRLADVHPGPLAGGHWVGLRTVLVECIRGTATNAAARSQDFRPLAGREPADWRSRWSRLQAAERDQSILPPVELVRTGADYWVVDGHNRVALARERGQLWIDADVTELELGTRSAAVAAKEN